MSPAEDLARLRASSPRALTHHLPQAPRDALRELADATPADLVADVYGAGSWLEAFEARIARELGKEAAVFLPTGTMAQQIALRIWCDRALNRTIAFHPTCHLEIHESRSYAMLHDMHALLVGAPTRLMTVADVRAIVEPLAALLVELPQREIGALLPAWDDLVTLCATAREVTGAKLHLDGARLWEAAPYYGRTHAEIAALFDSAYVSFYKGLGGMAGAMLAGDADFIAEARVWQHRHGGRLVSLAPLALSAQRGFERNLPKMAAFAERARTLALRFATIDGVVPNVPQTNTFHVFLRGEKEALEARAHAYAKRTGTFVFARLATTVVPGIQKWEFVVGDATMALAVDEIVAAVRTVMGSESIGSAPRPHAKRNARKRDAAT
ncbi:MAG: aminotransferase class I/II-fold pyridoxal phosphate-dependent enzyme [Vulcanimicrobiaceae bacterium]